VHFNSENIDFPLENVVIYDYDEGIENKNVPMDNEEHLNLLDIYWIYDNGVIFIFFEFFFIMF